MKRSLAKGAGIALLLLLAGCAGSGDDRANTPEQFDAISADDTLTLIGTEPFWNMVIVDDQLTYSSPDTPDGKTITITRFAGNNGLGLTGELQGNSLQIAVSPGECSDGMSDRAYPFTVTASWGDDTLYGCGFTGAAGNEIEEQAE